MMDKEFASRIKSALTVAKMAIEQGNPLTARVAANGPTIRMVIMDAENLVNKVLRGDMELTS